MRGRVPSRACCPVGGGLSGGPPGQTAGDDGESEGGETDGGTGGSGSDSDETGGSSPDVPAADDSDSGPSCGGDTLELTFIPANVVLVLDKSGSMTTENWDHDGDSATPDQARWTSLYDVVENLFETYDETMNFGAALFPSKSAASSATSYDLSCAIEESLEVPVAPANGATILATIPGRNGATAGGTPSRFGIQNAVNHLAELDDETPRVMILVTDGAANCVEGSDTWYKDYDYELETEVAAAYSDLGIPTYVVGIDIGDDPVNNVDPLPLSEAINAVALAGGVAPRGIRTVLQRQRRRDPAGRSGRHRRSRQLLGQPRRSPR